MVEKKNRDSRISELFKDVLTDTVDSDARKFLKIPGFCFFFAFVRSRCQQRRRLKDLLGKSSVKEGGGGGDWVYHQTPMHWNNKGREEVLKDFDYSAVLRQFCQIQ